MRPLALALAAALAAAARPAKAGPSVSLNGVAIDGVTSQRFENATVVIDERGDVHIEAKGYAVRAGGAAPAPAPAVPGKLTRRYFLVTEHDAPGTQYDLAIFINSQWIREVKATEPQVVMEVTRYLQPGHNKVVVAATKHIAGDRLAYGKDVSLRLVVGEGSVGGDHVLIDNPLLEMRRTAAEIDDRTEEYVLDAR